MLPKPDTLADVNKQPDTNSENPTISDAVENNRGREAATPTEIPARGWRDIFDSTPHSVRLKPQLALRSSQRLDTRCHFRNASLVGLRDDRGAGDST